MTGKFPHRTTRGRESGRANHVCSDSVYAERDIRPLASPERNMSVFSQLPENKEGSVVDRVALLCALVSVVCVLGAHALDRLAQSGAPPHGAAVPCGGLFLDRIDPQERHCGPSRSLRRENAVALTPVLRQIAAPACLARNNLTSTPQGLMVASALPGSRAPAVGLTAHQFGMAFHFTGASS